MDTTAFVIALTTMAATLVLAVLTGVLAVSTWQLSRTTQQQTAIHRENQQRAADREKPELLVREYGHSIGHTAADGSPTVKRFDGFKVTNIGAVAVTTTGVGASFAVPAESDRESQTALGLAPLDWNGHTVQTDRIPAKLEPNDRVTVLFDSDDLRRIGRHYQWQRQDSHDAVHAGYGWWMLSESGHTVPYRMEPGPEFRPPRGQPAHVLD